MLSWFYHDAFLFTGSCPHCWIFYSSSLILILFLDPDSSRNFLGKMLAAKTSVVCDEYTSNTQFPNIGEKVQGSTTQFPRQLTQTLNLVSLSPSPLSLSISLSFSTYLSLCLYISIYRISLPHTHTYTPISIFRQQNTHAVSAACP